MTGSRLTIAIAYGGREEIADAIRALILDKIRQGATLETIAEEITPEAVDRPSVHSGTFLNPTSSFRTNGEVHLSAPSSGKASTASSISRTSTGPTSARSTFSARSVHFNSVCDASDAETSVPLGIRIRR